MNCAYYNKFTSGSWQSEQNIMQENLDLDMVVDEPKKEERDPKLSLKNILFKHKKPLDHSHLDKFIMPKDALEVLQQFKGLNISDINIESNADGNFIANVNVNSKPYTAKGHSKKEAKKMVYELALRDCIVSKLLSSGDNDTSEDDMTIFNLASFATYKLFEEWERDGYDMFQLADNYQSANQSVINELPANWETMHPASVLNIMRPGSKFIPRGGQPNGLQGMTVVIDSQEFFSYGRSKKLARRNVAIMACNALFGTNFLN